jgi:membrane protease YdiL (CAAX protease family)
MSYPYNAIPETSLETEASPVRKILVALLAFPLILLLNVIIVLPLNAFMDLDIIALVFIMVISEILVAILALSATNQLGRWKAALRLKNFRLKNIAIGLGVGVILLILQQTFSIAALMLGAQPKSSETSAALGQITGTAKYAMLFFVVPVLVPFIEELFFRGLIFGLIRDSGVENKKRALIFGAIASAVIFGLAHFQGFSSFTDITVLGTTAIIGLTNCWLVYKTDSLYTAIACHLSYNLSTSGLIFLASLVHQ